LGRPLKHKRSSSAQTTFEGSSGASQMGLQNEMGVYETADVEEALAEHMDDVRGCYGRAGRAQRYAGGKVTLRFMVSGDGKTNDVLVIASDLGNYEVEHCLVELGRAVKFPAPNGNKPTSFEYPVEFRSTHEVQVQDLDDSPKVERDVASAMHSLASCGSISDSGASAIFYVEPNGTVGSVGLAADSPVNEQAAACAVREMRRWRISASLPGRMLRCRTSIPSMVASADAHRLPPISDASRRRRR